MDGRAILDLARNLALVKHADQTRSGSGEPYFNHLDRVAKRCYGWRQMTVAYLHDILEDTNITSTVLRQIGFPSDIVEGVVTLTRTSGEDYDRYISRVATSGTISALVVKLADLEDNLSDLDVALPPHRARTMRARYASAVDIITRSLEEGGHA